MEQIRANLYMWLRKRLLINYSFDVNLAHSQVEFHKDAHSRREHYPKIRELFDSRGGWDKGIIWRPHETVFITDGVLIWDLNVIRNVQSCLEYLRVFRAEESCKRNAALCHEVLMSSVSPEIETAAPPRLRPQHLPTRPVNKDEKHAMSQLTVGQLIVFSMYVARTVNAKVPTSTPLTFPPIPSRFLRVCQIRIKKAQLNAQHQ